MVCINIGLFSFKPSVLRIIGQTMLRQTYATYYQPLSRSDVELAWFLVRSSWIPIWLHSALRHRVECYFCVSRVFLFWKDSSSWLGQPAGSGSINVSKFITIRPLHFSGHLTMVGNCVKEIGFKMVQSKWRVKKRGAGHSLLYIRTLFSPWW